MPLEKVCARYNVTLMDVLRRNQTKRVAVARDACMAHLYSIGFSTTEVGDLMARDHSTVSACLKRHRAREGAGDGA